MPFNLKIINEVINIMDNAILLAIIVIGTFNLLLQFTITVVPEYSIGYSEGMAIEYDSLPLLLILKLVATGIAIYFTANNVVLLLGLLLLSCVEARIFISPKNTKHGNLSHYCLVVGVLLIALGLYIAFVRHLYPGFF